MRSLRKTIRVFLNNLHESGPSKTRNFFRPKRADDFISRALRNDLNADPLEDVVNDGSSHSSLEDLAESAA